MTDKPAFLENYTPVNERILAFYKLYPSGSIQTIWVDELTNDKRITFRATVYRTPDDARPCTGTSWMAIPGATSFTRGSECENAETSAIGRALGALGIGIERGVASADEVAIKSGDGEAADETSAGMSAAPTQATEPMRRKVFAQMAEHGLSKEQQKNFSVLAVGKDSSKTWTAADVDTILEKLGTELVEAVKDVQEPTA